MPAPTVRARDVSAAANLPPPLPTLSFCGGTSESTSDRRFRIVVWCGVSVIQLNQNSLKIPILLTVLLHTTFHLRINEACAGGLPASGLKTASENKGEKSILPVWKICSLVISDNQSTLLYIEWNCKTMMYMLSWIRSLAVFCSNITFFSGSLWLVRAEIIL